MAKNINKKLEISYRFPRHPYLHLKIKMSGLCNIWRKYMRKLFGAPTFPNEIIVAATDPCFDLEKDEFLSNQWAYCGSFWTKHFHEKLVSQCPPKRFFDPIKYITKSYDIGFRWSYKDKTYPEYLSDFPAYKLSYDYLSSKEFCNKLTSLVGDDVERVCYKILMTRAYGGSSIIPHIDSHNEIGNINLVIFIDGNDGGLGIWQDNEFKKKIFIPKKLTNTCMLYDMCEEFYHGFEPMKKGKYRRTINATYKKAT